MCFIVLAKLSLNWNNPSAVWLTLLNMIFILYIFYAFQYFYKYVFLPLIHIFYRK